MKLLEIFLFVRGIFAFFGPDPEPNWNPDPNTIRIQNTDSDILHSMHEEY